MMTAPTQLSRASRMFGAWAVVACTAGTLSATAAATGRQSAVDSQVSTPCPDMEEFLKTAKIGPRRELSVGVTAPSRASLRIDSRAHDAEIQTVDVSKAVFEQTRGTEMNFRDSWQFNVAGYELAKILALNMVPPYVERNVGGQPASVAWWIDDTMMERQRYQRHIQPPDSERWNGEMYAVRVFHQLIYETDPNLTNILITKDWRIWMIDFTRAFRPARTLQNPKDLVKIDRALLAKLRTLTPELLEQKLGRWVAKPQIEGLLARRGLIVRFFDDQVARRGEAAVLYDLRRTAEPCGTGLQ